MGGDALGASGEETVRVTGENLFAKAAAVLAESTHETASAVADTLPSPGARPARADKDLVSRGALDLLVAAEVGSPRLYTRKYQRPVWPAGDSGPTIGVGSDLGMMTRETVDAMWPMHPQLQELYAGAGMHGSRGKEATARMQHVVTPWPLAEAQFRQLGLVKYYRIARRAFPGFDALPMDAQGALVDLVYQRGSGMAGDRRSEMRTLRDQCVPRGDLECMARTIRAMPRHWAGTVLAKNLAWRCECRALLIEGRPCRYPA